MSVDASRPAHTQLERGGSLNQKVDERTDGDRALARPVRDARYDLAAMSAHELGGAFAIGRFVCGAEQRSQIAIEVAFISRAATARRDFDSARRACTASTRPADHLPPERELPDVIADPVLA